MGGLLQMAVHQGTMHGMGSAKMPWARSFPAPAYRTNTQFISQWAKVQPGQLTDVRRWMKYGLVSETQNGT